MPSTNVMTTNTTQLAIDVTIALIAWTRGSAQDVAERGQARSARARLALYWPPMAGFIAGTAIGAVCYEFVGAKALIAPLAVAYALLVWSMRRGRQPAPA